MWALSVILFTFLRANTVNGCKVNGEKVNRMNKAGGGLMEATERLKRQGLKRGGIAKGCGAVMSNRRKTTKVF